MNICGARPAKGYHRSGMACGLLGLYRLGRCFAHPAFTERQKAYARALDERMIYTPQFIVNGVESSFGGQRAEVASLIQKYAQLAPGAELSIRRMGASYEITLQNAYYSRSL